MLPGDYLYVVHIYQFLFIFSRMQAATSVNIDAVLNIGDQLVEYSQDPWTSISG